MSKCPICDTENAPGLTVCDFCGSELPETKKCQACGEEIPKNASYCPICKNLADVKPASSSFGGGNGMPMYYVVVEEVGDDRQEVIKVVQELAKCSFEEAREIIDSDEACVLSEVPKLEAEIAVSKLRGAGATANMDEVYSDDGNWEGGSSSGNSGSRTSSARSSSAGGEKSKLVAGLLALFGGGLGLHSFYLGYTTKGIMHLLLCFTGISAIWALIEAVQIFTGSMPDADGNPLV